MTVLLHKQAMLLFALLFQELSPKATEPSADCSNCKKSGANETFS